MGLPPEVVLCVGLYSVFAADLPGYGHEKKIVRVFLYCIGWV